jgi:hypothetical protein
MRIKADVTERFLIYGFTPYACGGGILRGAVVGSLPRPRVGRRWSASARAGREKWRLCGRRPDAEAGNHRADGGVLS